MTAHDPERAQRKVRQSGIAPRVFISYSRQDFHAAEQVAAALRRSGSNPWLDTERLSLGADWSASIRQAIDEADVVVVLASRGAMASPFVSEEWRRARARGIPVYVAILMWICRTNSPVSRLWTYGVASPQGWQRLAALSPTRRVLCQLDHPAGCVGRLRLVSSLSRWSSASARHWHASSWAR